jgi:DME family drug/metabolite transporter
MDRRGALGLTLLAAVLWGTSFPANRIGLDATDPWTFMIARFGIAFAATALLALALRSLEPRWLRNPWVWATSIANALSYQVQFLGQPLTSPGAAALMVNAGNLAVPLFAFLVHRERLGGVKAPALGLAALGIVLVGTRGDLQELASSAFLGSALTLAAGLCFALVIVLNKAALGGKEEARSLVGLVAWITGLTALFALPGALLLGTHAMPPQALGAAAYTAVFCTTFAFLLWIAGLRELSSVVSGLLLLGEIVVAFVLSLALGLEVLTLPGVVGGACIMGAILLASRASAEEARSHPSAAEA